MTRYPRDLEALRGVAAVYVKDPHLVVWADLRADAAAIGGWTAARAFWTAEGWRFEVDPRNGDPLANLLHEVGHIRLGHTRPRPVAADEPAPGPIATQAEVEGILASISLGWERDADAWADRELARWERAWQKALADA